jgi:hypothetical protein
LQSRQEGKLRALLFFLGALLVFGVAGCGGDQSGEKAAESGSQETSENPSASAQLPPSDVTSNPGDQVVVEPVTTMPLEGVFIKPFFGDEGTGTELSIAAGERFSFGVWAETPPPYTTAAAQYEVELPPGVRILSVNEFPGKVASIGNYAANYQIAYACQPSGRFRLVEYFCIADPEFTGGDVKVQPGYDSGGNPYLGFSTCDYQHAPAAAGSASLKLK